MNFRPRPSALKECVTADAYALERRWQGAPVTTGEDQDQAVPARRARPSRRRCRRGGARLPPPSASSRVSRIPSSRVRSRAAPDTHRRSRARTQRDTQRPSYHVACRDVVREKPLYSSQRRIEHKRRTTCFRRMPGDARSWSCFSDFSEPTANARVAPCLSLLNLSRTLQCGFAFSRSGSGTSRQRPSALPSGLVLA